jgi:hypothetical protein
MHKKNGERRVKYRGTIAYRTGLGGNVPEGFLASVVPAWDFLVREHSESREHWWNFNFMRGLSCMLHDSANQIADGFLGDWVLFLDTDHVFKSDAFYEMVTAFEENDLDILTGFAQKRQPPYLPLIQKTNFDPLLPFEPIIPGPIEKNLLIPIDAAGLACLMVRREVFTSISSKLNEKPFDFRAKFKPPYYRGQEIDSEAYNPSPPFELESYDDIVPKDRRSDEFYWEDISFFWRASLLGFKSWCAPWIKFHHIETRLVTDDLMQIPKPSPIPQ